METPKWSNKFNYAKFISALIMKYGQPHIVEFYGSFIRRRLEFRANRKSIIIHETFDYGLVVRVFEANGDERAVSRSLYNQTRG